MTCWSVLRQTFSRRPGAVAKHYSGIMWRQQHSEKYHHHQLYFRHMAHTHKTHNTHAKTHKKHMNHAQINDKLKLRGTDRTTKSWWLQIQWEQRDDQRSHYASCRYCIPTSWNIIKLKQESSAKLTNQRVSYVFTSSPFSSMPVIFCLLPSSSIVILVFYLFSYMHQWTACNPCMRTVSVNTVHWYDASS